MSQDTAASRSLAAGFPPVDDSQWRALVDKVLKGADPLKRLVTRTADGIEIEPLYTRPQKAVPRAQPAVADPITRGSPVRRAAGGWRIGEVHAEADPAALSGAIREGVVGGAEAFTLRLEATGQSGLPADFRTLEATLAEVPLGRMRISLQPGAHAIHAALSLGTIARQRCAVGQIARFGIDPLGTLASTGELVILRRDGKGLATSVPWLPPGGATLTADAGPYHEAGASEAQEIAALAATLVAYARCLEGEGLSPANAFPRIALAITVDADLMLGIAKLRAARRVVGRIAEACGAPDAAGRMQFAATTSQRMMARRDPWVNMLRVTAACAVAAMGGADEITVLPFTWALGQPDAFARRIARNVGLVLREEAGLGRVMDPSGGAWSVERLTQQLANKAWSIFQEWESEGGMQAALTSGLVQDQIAAVADARSKDIATRKIELTGTSAFPLLGDDSVRTVPWPAAAPLPASPVAHPLVALRLATPFESLRDRADGAPVPPRVFLASLGGQAEHGARTLWAGNLLAAGGIATVGDEGFTSSADAGLAFAESGARVACICGSDPSYALLGEATAMALKGAGATRVYLAGRPRDQESGLKAAGVDGFLYAGMDTVAALSRLLDETGA